MYRSICNWLSRSSTPSTFAPSCQAISFPVRHGSGAFVVDLERKPKETRLLQQAQEDVHQLVRKLQKNGLLETEIRRLFEAEFTLIAQE